MLIIGAKGHATEILEIFHKNGEDYDLNFYDDINYETDFLYKKFNILHKLDEVIELFKSDNSFVIGIGGTKIRSNLANKFIDIGGQLKSIISKDLKIGSFDVKLGEGLNIMSSVFISNNVSIGNGTLINYGVSIHHDCTIGEYCEISPKAQLLGGVTIEDYCFIGAGAIILPKVKICRNSIIGAGAVVLHDVSENEKIVGVPGKSINKL
jgi:sugar O-acyltransferase (sialic acid O-acetyltransferase NeuD family)